MLSDIGVTTSPGAAPDSLKKQEVQPLVVREAYLKENPDAVQAWLLAQEDAKQWIIDNEDKAVELLNSTVLGGQSAKVAGDYIKHFVDDIVPKIQPQFKVKQEAIELMIETAVKIGAVKEGQVKFEDLVPDFARA